MAVSVGKMEKTTHHFESSGAGVRWAFEIDDFAVPSYLNYPQLKEALAVGDIIRDRIIAQMHRLERLGEA